MSASYAILFALFLLHTFPLTSSTPFLSPSILFLPSIPLLKSSAFLLILCTSRHVAV